VNHVDLQDSIDKLYSWCSLNKLQLNIDKCEKLASLGKPKLLVLILTLMALCLLDVINFQT
jgi:hypothetical protein